MTKRAQGEKKTQYLVSGGEEKNIADFFETSIDYVVGYTELPHKIEPTIKLSLNRDEAKLIEKYQNLSPKRRSVIQSVIDSYSENY